jgi:hypothetical protein
MAAGSDSDTARVLTGGYGVTMLQAVSIECERVRALTYVPAASVPCGTRRDDVMDREGSRQSLGVRRCHR